MEVTVIRNFKLNDLGNLNVPLSTIKD